MDSFTCSVVLYRTRDWRLDIQHSALLAQDSGTLIDDAQGHGLLQPTLLGEVSFEQVHPRPALCIKHLLHGKPVGQGEGDRWRGKMGGKDDTDVEKKGVVRGESKREER